MLNGAVQKKKGIKQRAEKRYNTGSEKPPFPPKKEKRK